jgi:UDP-N-acetyl-D-mannosaminuronic acid dehydrogenase
MHTEFETVSVIGLGYIGLPTAAILASRGVKVIGVDVNEEVVKTINKGLIHIVEPELDIVVSGAVQSGRLEATTQPRPADAYLVAVPTPFKGDHEPDLSYIESAARAIAPVLKKGNLVVLESTSPVGATEQMAKWLSEQRPDLSFPQQAGEESDIRVAHCPERVLPGHVVRELVENDRVIGGMTPACSEAASKLYKIFVEGECIITNVRTAEMCKLTENSFRDVNIAFANELSLICDRLEIDVWELIALANRHPRVNILQPGPGVGGHCIAVDPWFIVSTAPEESQLIKVAREVNNGKPMYVLQKVMEALGGSPDSVVACLGLAFKANIDDLRESPSMEIVSRLAEKIRNRILVVEPNINVLPKTLAVHENVVLSNTEDAIAQADILVLLVDHDQFKDVDNGQLKSKKLIDTRGIWR